MTIVRLLKLWLAHVHSNRYLSISVYLSVIVWVTDCAPHSR